MKSLISKVSKIFLILVFAVLMSSEAFAALKGTIRIDGSSTVFPITEAVAEEFGKVHRRVRVTVGVSGTGGGFKKFLAGETVINDASRRIKDKEIKKAKKEGIKYIELPVAFDGLSVVVNKKNNWADYLSVKELHKIWKPGSLVKNWNQVRSSFPNVKMTLFAPGTDSGTFDYFTKKINGKSQRSRSDFTKSEDDNVLVQGVSGSRGALGYFGYAYYIENKDKLNVVPIKYKNNAPVKPTMVTINNGSYKPLARPIFIYVRTDSLKKKVVYEFVKFYLKNSGSLSKEVGYIPLPKSQYEDGLKKVEMFK